MKKTTVNMINVHELMNLLSEKRGAQFVTLIAKTDSGAKKTDNPYPNKQIMKICKLNGVVNWKYANSVNNQRDREGNTETFVPKPRKWGVRMEGLPFVEHKGNYYLEVKCEKTLGMRYEDCNGTEIASDDAKKFITERNSNAQHQGVEKEIILADYGVNNIKVITFGGNTYMIDNSVTEPTTKMMDIDLMDAV